MNPIKRAMPALARHEGISEGVYRYLDADGRLLDEHPSRLVCRILDEGPYPYRQSNHYTWADGRTDTRDYPAHLRHGRVVWDNARIAGWAVEAGADKQHGTLLLCWTCKDAPGQRDLGNGPDLGLRALPLACVAMAGGRTPENARADRRGAHRHGRAGGLSNDLRQRGKVGLRWLGIHPETCLVLGGKASG